MNNSADIIDVPGWPQYVEYLHRYFYEHADAKCLLWINPGKTDPFEADQFVQERRVQVAIHHPRFDVARGPYLVPLELSRSADADTLRTSVEIAWEAWTSSQLCDCQGQPIAGWVEASAQPKALALYWARHCHLHRHNGLSRLLRFHDPSVREWLWPTLTARQQRALLGPATSLFSIGRTQSLIHHAAPDPGGSERFPPLLLEDNQWTQIEDYAAVHAAWVEWGAKPKDQGWEQGIFTALSHASRYGVIDVQDRQLFALHALQLNGNFHTSPCMRPVWERTRAGDFYSSAVEEVFERPANQLHTIGNFHGLR